LPPNLLSAPSAYSIGDLVPMEAIQDLHIRMVVASTRSLRSAAAVLGIHPDTIVRRLKRSGSDAPPIRSESDEAVGTSPAGSSQGQLGRKG